MVVALPFEVTPSVDFSSGLENRGVQTVGLRGVHGRLIEAEMGAEYMFRGEGLSRVKKGTSFIMETKGEHK